MTDHLEELRQELNKTGVISTQFKSMILAYAQAAMADAYRRGEEAVRSALADHDAENVQVLQRRLKEEQEAHNRTAELLARREKVLRKIDDMTYEAFDEAVR
jgi:spermidine synthase